MSDRKIMKFPHCDVYTWVTVSHFHIYRIWDCDTCTKDVTLVGDFMVSETASNAIIENLNGEDFCQDPEMNLDENQIEVCQEYISAFMPQALGVLFGNLNEVDICNSVFNIC